MLWTSAGFHTICLLTWRCWSNHHCRINGLNDKDGGRALLDNLAVPDQQVAHFKDGTMKTCSHTFKADVEAHTVFFWSGSMTLVMRIDDCCVLPLLLHVLLVRLHLSRMLQLTLDITTVSLTACGDVPALGCVYHGLWTAAPMLSTNQTCQT